MAELSKIVNKKPRLAQLKVLLGILAERIDESPGARDLAQLSRQFRETLQEIEEIEGAEQNNDDIAEIISEREPWMPGAVRPDRS